MRKFLFLSLICGTLGLTGCSVSKYSQTATEPVTAIMETHPNQAAVVFIRDEIGGCLISAPLAYYQEELDDYHFLGVLNAYQTALVTVDPGQYVFVVGGESQHAAKVQLEGGKLYALNITAIGGTWKARFDFETKTINKRLINQLKKYPRIVSNEQGLRRLAPKMEIKVAHFKLGGAPEKFLLNPEDGMPFEEVKALFDKAAGK